MLLYQALLPYRHLYISLVESFVQRRSLHLGEFVTKCLEFFSSTLSACVQRFCSSRPPMFGKVSKTPPVLAIQPTSTFPSVSQFFCISIFAILLGSVGDLGICLTRWPLYHQVPRPCCLQACPAESRQALQLYSSGNLLPNIFLCSCDGTSGN